MSKSKQPTEKTKKDKQEYVDDGHTVYSMDGVKSPFDVLRRGKRDNAGLNRKEKRAAIKAAFQVYLPVLLGTIACFALVGVLIYFWLS